MSADICAGNKNWITKGSESAWTLSLSFSFLNAIKTSQIVRKIEKCRFCCAKIIPYGRPCQYDTSNGTDMLPKLPCCFCTEWQSLSRQSQSTVFAVSDRKTPFGKNDGKCRFRRSEFLHPESGFFRIFVVILSDYLYSIVCVSGEAVSNAFRTERCLNQIHTKKGCHYE